MAVGVAAVKTLVMSEVMTAATAGRRGRKAPSGTRSDAAGSTTAYAVHTARTVYAAEAALTAVVTGALDAVVRTRVRTPPVAADGAARSARSPAACPVRQARERAADSCAP
ncbi:hypothetical protein ACPCSC_31760 [Streptomyces lavendulocolor]|uniref:hypothetical protein n=1 Tax=Streptomyces lavendulocolor TaxID=67316 RepID=UPI003C2C3534